METVLLVDDKRLFKAVEGSCLRREKCHLVMASPDGLFRTATEKMPGLIVAFLSAGTADQILRVVRSRKLAKVPLLLLEPQSARVGRTLEEAIARRRVPAARLKTPPATATDEQLKAFDLLMDEKLRSIMPWGRRGGDRVSINLPVRCRADGFSGTLRTKNISPSGLFLKTNRSIDTGTELDVHFTLPASVISGEPVLVDARCEVVRQVGRGGHQDHDLIPGLGVRFVDLGEKGRMALTRVAAGRQASGGRAARAAG